MNIKWHDNCFIRQKQFDIFAMVVILGQYFFQIKIFHKLRLFLFLWIIIGKVFLMLVEFSRYDEINDNAEENQPL